VGREKGGTKVVGYHTDSERGREVLVEKGDEGG